MRCCTVALGSVVCLGVAGPGWAADDGPTAIQDSRSLFEQVFASPYDAASDPFIRVDDVSPMHPGDVIVGRRGSGEEVVIVVISATAFSRKLGVSPVQGEPLELEGLLIGPVGAALTTSIAFPTDGDGRTWAVVPSPLGISPISARPAARAEGPRQTVGGALRPIDYCTTNCLEDAIEDCGTEPPCNTINLPGSGIQACMAVAACRLEVCMWAACMEGRSCACEWYQSRCQRYFRRWGEYPPPSWAPGNPGLACGGSGGLAGTACLAVYVVEMTLCLPQLF